MLGLGFRKLSQGQHAKEQTIGSEGLRVQISGRCVQGSRDVKQAVVALGEAWAMNNGHDNPIMVKVMVQQVIYDLCRRQRDLASNRTADLMQGRESVEWLV